MQNKWWKNLYTTWTICEMDTFIFYTHTQHVGMSLTGLFDIEYSNALCSGVTEASLFICAFIFSVLQGVASQQNPGGDRVTGQMGKGWVIHHRKNHGHWQTKEKKTWRVRIWAPSNYWMSCLILQACSYGLVLLYCSIYFWLFSTACCCFLMCFINTFGLYFLEDIVTVFNNLWSRIVIFSCTLTFIIIHWTKI